MKQLIKTQSTATMTYVLTEEYEMTALLLSNVVSDHRRPQSISNFII
ncbi:MAG TPA: hypothetical protein VJ643_07860 [Nitrososphaera sp.]|nr:hypothetical protein [Nitrososphaera sp.]